MDYRDINKCVFCGKEVKDYKPEYCCNGDACGCYGLPVNHASHIECEIINTLEHAKKLSEKDPKSALCYSFDGSGHADVKFDMSLGDMAFHTDKIPHELANYILENMSLVKVLSQDIDFLRKLLEEHRDKL